jgi:MoaA/NifB/PqqE/SkfB family radical SAM enzyme
MSEQEMLDVINQSIEMGVKIFYIFGGEPLLRKEFFTVVDYISNQKGLFRETVTNGTALTHRICSNIIDSGLNKIWISIDGPEEVHERLRGVPGSFARTYQGLKDLCEEKRSRGSKILIDLAFTASAENYRYLPKVIELVKDLDLYEINVRHMGVFLPEDIQNLNTVIGQKIGKTVEPGSICFSAGEGILLTIEQAKELKEILLEARRRCKENGIPLHVEPALLDTFDWKKGKKVDSCLHLWTQINISPAGDVIPCLWYDLFPMGNIRNSCLKEIWNNGNYRHLRKNFSHLTACSKCCYFYLNLPDNIRRAVEVANFPLRSLIFR